MATFKAAISKEYALFLCATSILTRIPVTNTAHSTEDISLCCRYFSAVGLLIGVLQGLILWGFLGYFDNFITVTVALTAGILLTGALHEDGLADTFDALGGYDLEAKLRIMKDSQVGTYGVLALCSNFVLKAALLTYIVSTSVELALTTIILSQSLSRSVCVTPTLFLPYLRPEQGKLPLKMFDLTSIMIGWAVSLCALFLLVDFPINIIAATILFTLLWTLFIKKHFSGFSGDILGCTQQLSEVCILFTCAFCIRPHLI